MTEDIALPQKEKQSFWTKTKQFFFSSKKQGIITLVVALVIIFVLYRIFHSASTTPQYETATVTKGSIISSVTESGNVSTNSVGGVGSPTTGIVEEMYVKDGQSVTAGENLFKVKSTATAQEIASAYASFLSSQNNLTNAKNELYALQSQLFVANQNFVNDTGISNPTTQDMQNPKYIEEDDAWLQAQANYLNQQNVISQAQASYNAASLAYEATQDSIVTAPISGTVANISVQPGDEVTASSGNLSTDLSSGNSGSSGSTILTIGNFANPYIKVQASEVDIPQIKPGQMATITLNAFPGKTYVGKVSQIDTVGTVSSGVVTYNVYVDFVAPPSSIEPGMSATVVIETARKDNVLTVPSGAVQTSGGQATVRVLQNGQVSSVAVTTGISSDTQTEITSGLSAGETVVTGVQTTATTASGTSAFSSSTRLFGGAGGGFGGGGAVIRGGGAGRGAAAQ